MEIFLLPLEDGHALVSEMGVFAIGKDAEAAQALGQRLYARLRLPVVPLVVGGPRQGYHRGVLHLGSLEEHFPHLPRVLTPEEVQALARFLEGKGPRPEVRLRLPGHPSPEASQSQKERSPKPEPSQGQGSLSQEPPEPRPSRGAVFVRGGDWRNREVVASPTKALPPTPTAAAPEATKPRVPSPLRHLIWPPVLLVFYAALLHPLPGLVAFFPAIGFLLTQDRLLRRGGYPRRSSGRYGAFSKPGLCCAGRPVPRWPGWPG